MPWTTTADLAIGDGMLADAAVPALAAAMHDHIHRLRADKELETFLERLRRSWAIETGILERLYNVSDAATKTLLERGLDAAYLASGDTGNQDPNEVMAILYDQKATIDGLYAFIAEGGELTKSFIRELHQKMTAHQNTYEAVDQFGRPVQVVMEHGKWKTHPNSIGNAPVCPPEHVDSEIERLIALDGEHTSQQVPPVVQAAWIHHRFLLIHPFADGNGRIARCLATLVLVRAKMMPLVVERGARGAYIDALRSADGGDLGPFVRLVEGIQRGQLQRAMDVAFDMRREQQLVADRIESIGDKLQRKAAIARGERQALIATADQVMQVLSSALSDAQSQLATKLTAADPSFQSWTRSAARGSNEAGYNWGQARLCAEALGYFPNGQTYRAWAYLGLRIGVHHEILFSLHGLGMGHSDVIACSVMSYERYAREDGIAGVGDIHPLVDYPFTFTANERPEDVLERFRRWATAGIDAGLAAVERTL